MVRASVTGLDWQVSTYPAGGVEHPLLPPHGEAGASAVEHDRDRRRVGVVLGWGRHRRAAFCLLTLGEEQFDVYAFRRRPALGTHVPCPVHQTLRPAQEPFVHIV